MGDRLNEIEARIRGRGNLSHDGWFLLVWESELDTLVGRVRELEEAIFPFVAYAMREKVIYGFRDEDVERLRALAPSGEEQE